MTRPRGMIDIALYQNLVDQCLSIGINRLYLFLHGEPTLHPALDWLVLYAKESEMKVRLHTNGSHNVSPLGVDDLHLSVNADMSRRFWKHVDLLFGQGIQFSLDVVEGVEANIPEKYKAFIYRKDYYNWHEQDRGGNTALCSHPYKYMTVYWDGRVAACCADYNASYIVGDANKDTLDEIWNCPRMQHLRTDSAPLCKGCNLKHVP